MGKVTPFIEKKPSSLRYYQEGVPEVDLGAWRLRVTGLVETEVALSMDDLRALPSIYQHRRNVCVCLWTIKRHWEGLLLKDVLALAGVDWTDPTLYMRQLSHGTARGGYDSTVNLQSAVERGAMLAYDVDGGPLPAEQGFPLRFLDFGLYLYKCVKAVSVLEITRTNALGHWEEYAGYDLDGTIQPKRYYAVDLQRKFYFDGYGEVADSDV
ncbi:molybdopterin-dependent oxidoreductase [Caenispirillum salinarum]|uniref:molybdopterin-dependent oxidoreductase n=1 Tax=Caenispirillum salinarum TaxID=859058 RepID=UPI00384FEB3E